MRKGLTIAALALRHRSALAGRLPKHLFEALQGVTACPGQGAGRLVRRAAWTGHTRERSGVYTAPQRNETCPGRFRAGGLEMPRHLIPEYATTVMCLDCPKRTRSRWRRFKTTVAIGITAVTTGYAGYCVYEQRIMRFSESLSGEVSPDCKIF